MTKAAHDKRIVMTINEAIEKVAQAESWDTKTTYELGLLLWVLFRYYASRLSERR